MFRKAIDAQLERVRCCPQAGMLGEKVWERLEASLKRTTEMVTGSTMTHWVAREAAAENPLAAAHPELLTEAEKKRALDALRRQLDSGAMILPGPLTDCLTEQLDNKTDGFLEALARMEAHREEICAALTGGKLYQRIEDVTLSAGDTHNRGRSVMILHTDAGKLVYKPHDLRGDECVRSLAERFFPEFVGIPRSVALEDFNENRSADHRFTTCFGVCEFIEKRRAQGAEEAERFWYALGGLTAFVKLLGSTDLHYQNILCCGARPYIIDLETALSPVSVLQEEYVRAEETKAYLLRSPSASLLLPFRVEGMEISVLMNLGESGIAPEVDGKRVTVRSFLPAYREGYRAAYARAMERREEIAEAVKAFPPFAVRYVQRATRGYWDVLQKLYHHTAMATEEGREQSRATLEELLRESNRTIEPAVIDSEVRQLMRGDVPYFCTYTDSLALYGEGEKLAPERFGISPIDHALQTLSAMDREDEEFDLNCVVRAIEQYPENLGEGEKKASRTKENASRPEIINRREDQTTAAQPSRSPLSTEAAAEEAGRILGEMYALRIPTPGGRPLWGYVSHYSQQLSFSDASLFNGYTGLAVFAAACAAVLGDGQGRGSVDEHRSVDFHRIAEELTREATDEIRGLVRQWRRVREQEKYRLLQKAPAVGEGVGFAGILTGLALLRRYAPDERIETLTDQLLEILEESDFSACREPDRIGGLAGLVSALCRFEEYRDRKTIIRAAADRLLALKEFSYRGAVVWKTMSGTPRALSGAGHGMAGIAEALYAAADTLGDDRYLPAAGEALAYERAAYLRYADRFGTWADLRDFPPKSYMHGYCAGAPGIGIMLARLMERGQGGGTAAFLADRVRESVDALPLNICDHLCCGNAAIAEYCLSVGDRDAAARTLGAMYERRRREGGYRYSFYTMNNSVTASLFNGMCGIGYEMLRCAFPDIVISVL